MHQLKFFKSFLDRAMTDPRLAPCHISLYLGLFQSWVARNFQNPMTIAKKELMVLGKLNGKATYYKVIRELHEFGYIEYIPGFGKREQSQVRMMQLAPH